MLHKTRGIVFRFTRYGETSIIVSIFTELFGLQSYIVNGARSKSNKSKMALFQPLTLLDLVVYHKENASVMRMKEVRCYHPYQTINTDFKKSTIALFLTEVLNKSVKEQTHAQELLQFLFEAFIKLDKMQVGAENFHLIFLVHLSRHLGFGAYHTREMLTPFDSDQPEQIFLQEMLCGDFDTSLRINQVQRRNLLDVLLRFYTLHIETFGEMKSLAVVRELVG
ncbi:MAG: DNA repair protein RecO [Flammeovirgaceae bacterium]